MINYLIKQTAIKWYMLFDRTGFVFNILKEQSRMIRGLYYTAFILFTWFGMGGVEKMALKLLETNEIGLILFTSINGFIFYTVVGVAALIVTYESIYDLDMQDLISQRKSEQLEIKAAKKQWWRLRNLNILMRIAIYLFIYLLIFKFIEFHVALAFIEVHPNPTSYDMQLLSKWYDWLLNWVTLGYLVIVMTIEYFLPKRGV